MRVFFVLPRLVEGAGGGGVWGVSFEGGLLCREGMFELLWVGCINER